MTDQRHSDASRTATPAQPSQVDATSPVKPRPSAPAQDATDPALGSATLQAPWRLEYLQRLSEEEAKAKAPSTGCFLRDYWLTPDRDIQNNVVLRTSAGLILLNGFPYANGHLLVALGEGRGRLLEYTAEQRASLWTLTDAAMDLMETALQPQGVNMGVNQGRAAGAGVPQHLHVHLVPRWGGDVNFMTVVGRIRVMPSSLEAMAEQYRRAWTNIMPRWTKALGMHSGV